MEKTEQLERARKQAEMQFETIASMVERLEHVRECTDFNCDLLTDEEILRGINVHYHGQKATEEDREEYHDEHEAEENILTDPLTVQVRSGWCSPGEELKPEEYEILLCTGGPAVRISGYLSLDYQQPETASLQYQDWFTEWTEYYLNSEEGEILLKYANEFNFGDF